MPDSLSTSAVKLEPVEGDLHDRLAAELPDENVEYADDLDGDCCTICLQSFRDRTGQCHTYYLLSVDFIMSHSHPRMLS